MSNKLNPLQVEIAAQKLCELEQSDPKNSDQLNASRDRIKALMIDYGIDECLAVHSAFTAFDDNTPF